MVCKDGHETGKIVFCSLALIFFVLLFFAAPSVRAADIGYEQPGELKASAILKPELLKGKYHTVQDKVVNDGLFNHYTVESQFGTFQAGSTSNLKILVHEISAIAAMKQVETDDTALASLKQSGQNTVAGMKNLFNDPQGTVEGAASGVGSLFNRARETVGKRKPTDAEDSRFEQLVGMSKAKGEVATRYGVNVYSRNEKLQEELDRLGQADYLGGLGVGVATSFVPGVGGLVLSTSGTARLLNEAINTTPASELWLQNKNKLLAMGMNNDTVELFLNNPSFSPALATVLVAALESMKGVENRELFIKVGLQASDPDMAKTITEIAVMSAGYHKEIAPLKGFSPMARLTQGVRKDMTGVVLLPIDYLIWDQRVAGAATALSREAQGSGFELWVLGFLSKQATAELQKLGWKIYTDAESRLLPARK
ncbi:MAG: hypothetical protein OEM01_09875 [Desulfobulbaceae bacterium]|nr:hypothetical protein [Desulfobulbaceae bacterium]